jgi:hypothetical protein
MRKRIFMPLARNTAHAFRYLVPAFLVLGLCASQSLMAQGTEHHHDEDEGPGNHHDHLHFSHPLVTESPSPDSKLRLDFLRTSLREVDQPAANVMKLEVEHAFSRALSLSATASDAWMAATRNASQSRATSLELAVKGANFSLSDLGILLGGGLAFDIPLTQTLPAAAEKDKVEAEPFVDFAVKRDELEFVTLASYATSVARSGEREKRFQVMGSLLQHVSPRLEVLGEAAILRPLSGDGDRSFQVRLAPGVKAWPTADKDLALGVSVPIAVSGQKSITVLISALLHF